jgi:hypothetical protein
MTSKEYYDKYVKLPNEEVCSCGNTKLYSGWKYNKYCSTQCSEQISDRNVYISNRFKGVDRCEKLRILKEKRGIVDVNVSKRKLTIEINANKLGLTVFEYHSIIGKRGSDTITQENRDKSTITALETRFNNIKSNYKDYALFGETIRVQGYEPRILNYLQTILDENTLVANGKNIGWFKYNSSDGKQHMYFPDMIIPNFIVEVKSTYTFNQNRSNVFNKIGGVFSDNKNLLLVIPSISEVRKNKLDGTKKLLDWAISSQASKDYTNTPFVAIYDEGSTTILIGVESNDSKCRGSSRILEECDIVWSAAKSVAV